MEAENDSLPERNDYTRILLIKRFEILRLRLRADKACFSSPPAGRVKPANDSGFKKRSKSRRHKSWSVTIFDWSISMMMNEAGLEKYNRDDRTTPFGL